MYNESSAEFGIIGISLAVGFLFSWCFCKVFRIRSKGASHCGAIALTFLVMVPFHPFYLVMSLLPFLLGFVTGRSTKVSLIPTDTFSPRVKVSDIEYAWRAEQQHRLIHSNLAESFFLNPDVPADNKLAFLFQGFGLYRHARFIAMSSSWLYFSIYTAAVYSDSYDPTILLLLLSLPQGTAIGMLWKYVKGHPGPPKPEIGGRQFRPTLWSFVGSSLYGCTPAIGAAIATYFQHDKHPTLILIVDGVTILLCLFLVFQSVVVHLQRLHITNEGIIIAGCWATYGMRWDDTQKAVLRERRNILSGTDKLLVLDGGGDRKIGYPVSILSNASQNDVMREVRRRINVSSVFDEPSI